MEVSSELLDTGLKSCGGAQDGEHSKSRRWCVPRSTRENLHITTALQLMSQEGGGGGQQLGGEPRVVRLRVIQKTGVHVAKEYELMALGPRCWGLMGER